MVTIKINQKEAAARAVKLWNKRGKTVFIAVFLFIVGLSYIFFFSSKYILPNGTKYELTAMDSVSELAPDKTVTLLRWDYSEKQKLMEIELETDNQSFDGINTYSYSAVSRNAGTKSLKTETIVSTDTMQVVHILNVPSNFKEISFRMVNSDGTGNIIKLYTNYLDVTHVDCIESRTETQYRIMRLQSDIKECEATIAELESENAELEKTNENIVKTNESLEADKRYQTDVQIAETDKKIQENLRTSENNVKKIEDNKVLQQEQLDIIASIEEKISQLK